MTERMARSAVAVFGLLVVVAYAVAHVSDLLIPDSSRFSAPPPSCAHGWGSA
jgi:hypothetical protein